MAASVAVQCASGRFVYYVLFFIVSVLSLFFDLARFAVRCLRVVLRLLADDLFVLALLPFEAVRFWFAVFDCALTDDIPAAPRNIRDKSATPVIHFFPNLIVILRSLKYS
jgi:hypothetical protein